MPGHILPLAKQIPTRARQIRGSLFLGSRNNVFSLSGLRLTSQLFSSCPFLGSGHLPFRPPLRSLPRGMGAARGPSFTRFLLVLRLLPLPRPLVEGGRGHGGGGKHGQAVGRVARNQRGPVPGMRIEQTKDGLSLEFLYETHSYAADIPPNPFRRPAPEPRSHAGKSLFSNDEYDKWVTFFS